MKKIIITIFLIICLGIFCFSGYKIVNWYLSNKENEKINKETKQSINIADGEFKIDFDKLKEKNKDAIAYLKVNNTNIDYIVVKGNNNSFYLNHNFNRDYNISGWIFADYRNKFDETDKNIIIYGHNTNDGSMFGSLHNILSKEWQTNEDNLNITLITEMKEYTYKVFSVYKIKAEDYYIKTNFNNDFDEFINTVKKRSIYNFNENINAEDKILTLSTCSSSGKDRVVLHAKRG